MVDCEIIRQAANQGYFMNEGPQSRDRNFKQSTALKHETGLRPPHSTAGAANQNCTSRHPARSQLIESGLPERNCCD
jgi:hypothetical protein